MEYNSLDQYMHCISVNLRKNKLQFIRLVHQTSKYISDNILFLTNIARAAISSRQRKIHK